ncbi:MAG: fumarylacetoacetate hydrolase family protein [Spirochaetia bacterium]|nr:fumarylacetoacetate hydrolase family protein [Spirochaetia bacterium]
MAKNCIRYKYNDKIDWGLIHLNKIFPLHLENGSTSDLINLVWKKDTSSYLKGDGIQKESVEVLEPITKPCSIICQGANYVQHMIDSGLDPKDKSFNIFFSKTTASLFPARGSIKVPHFIELLDYEIELGLVFGKPMNHDTKWKESELPDFIAGFVMANDLSARDIQLPQLQWMKGKSYRGFCPTGPYLSILESGDFELLEQLELNLAVNDRLRQHDVCNNLIYKPFETIQELVQFCDLEVGDLLLTGTPSGCALRVPGKWMQRFAAMLPEKTKWKLFIKKQSQNGMYLKQGDRITSSIRTPDRNIDLGDQELTLEWETRPKSKGID